MDAGIILQLVASMFMVTAKVAAPLLLTAMFVGLLMGLLQAVTQLNDATLGFLPKVIAVAVALWFTLPWLLQELVGFTTRTFELMEQFPR
jgi:flagellar biosynthetic protein FliQ